MTEVNTTAQEGRFTLSEKDLFARLVKLERDKLITAADIKQVKADAKKDEGLNPKGIEGDEIKLIAKAAALFAKENFEETQEGAAAVFDKYKELTNY